MDVFGVSVVLSCTLGVNYFLWSLDKYLVLRLHTNALGEYKQINKNRCKHILFEFPANLQFKMWGYTDMRNSAGAAIKSIGQKHWSEGLTLLGLNNWKPRPDLNIHYPTTHFSTQFVC